MEKQYLNDYMNKEIPGKVTSKYGDVRTYRYGDVVANNKNASVSKKLVINNTMQVVSQNPNISVSKTQLGKVTLNVGKRGKHVVGHPNYIVGNGEVDMQTASNILNDFQGIGQKIERDGKILKEIVDTQGKYTGVFVDKKTGQRSKQVDLPYIMIQKELHIQFQQIQI